VNNYSKALIKPKGIQCIERCTTMKKEPFSEQKIEIFTKKKIKLKFSEFGGTSYLSFLIEFFRVMPEMLYVPF